MFKNTTRTDGQDYNNKHYAIFIELFPTEKATQDPSPVTLVDFILFTKLLFIWVDRKISSNKGFLHRVISP